MSASQDYTNELCFEENKAILADIESKNYNQAINRYPFLQSIQLNDQL